MSETLQSSKSSVAKDVFAYLLTFGMLYVGVISFMALLWQIINVQFPDLVYFSYENSYVIMRRVIASLIVVWPVFLILSRWIAKDLHVFQEKAHLWVRKWLLYFTVFVSAVTMIVDLITLINSFLSGELTTRFFLKVMVILVLASAVFAYQFWELRRGPTLEIKKMRLMAAGSCLAILIAIIAGFYFVGSPKTARAIRLDSQRVIDLQNIQYQVMDVWQRTESLPENLDQFSDPLSSFLLPVDPETGTAYAYKKTGKFSFELCADFLQETPSWDRPVDGKVLTTMRSFERYPMPYVDSGNENWFHESGYVCFERVIDPTLFEDKREDL